MRPDIVPGNTFPDYQLPDHTRTPWKLSELHGSASPACVAEELACRRSSGVGGQHVGIRGPAKRITRRRAGERSELQPRYILVHLHVLRSLR
jgi:hypothetical protein